MDSHDRHDDGVSAMSVGVVLAGFALALFGVLWDDAWHTDRGRDDLVSPPHLALYAGVATAVAVVAWWGWARHELGWRSLSAGPIGLSVLGAAVTLGSAPVDEWWHQSFGRDSVLWSPPHLVAVFGTIALVSGVILVAGRSAAERGDGTAVGLLVATGAGVVGGWQVLVLEYDTDVAQFSPLWYLPVLAVGLSASALIVQAAVGNRLRWPAAWSGLAYTLVTVLFIAVLSISGFSTPIVPVGVLALVIADIGYRRGWNVLVRSTAFNAALFLTYVPYLRVVDGGVAPSTGQAVLGAGLAVIAVGVTILIFDPTTRLALPGIAIGAAAVVLPILVGVLGAGPVLAHDPGQGIEVRGIELIAEVSDGRVELVVTLEGVEAGIEPTRVVARRAGRVLVGSLAGDESRWFGQVDLDQDGRWFVYVEARRGDQRLEAWLPVTAGAVGATSKQTALYLAGADQTASGLQLGAGVLLTLVAAGTFIRIALTVRSGWPPTNVATELQKRPSAYTE